MTILAVGKRIIALPIAQPEEKKKGNLIIPNKQSDQEMLKVVAYGPDCCADVGVGNILVVRNGTGIEIEIEGVKYLSLIEDQILAMILCE